MISGKETLFAEFGVYYTKYFPGGSEITAYLHKLLQLKYPVHVNAITLSRAEEILQEHSSIALDYQVRFPRKLTITGTGFMVLWIAIYFKPLPSF